MCGRMRADFVFERSVIYICAPHGFIGVCSAPIVFTMYVKEDVSDVVSFLVNVSYMCGTRFTCVSSSFEFDSNT